MHTARLYLYMCECTCRCLTLECTCTGRCCRWMGSTRLGFFWASALCLTPIFEKDQVAWDQVGSDQLVDPLNSSLSTVYKRKRQGAERESAQMCSRKRVCSDVAQIAATRLRACNAQNDTLCVQHSKRDQSATQTRRRDRSTKTPLT